MRAYYAFNTETANARTGAHYHANRDAVLAQQKGYREQNLDDVRAKDRQRAAAHSATKAATAKAWREQHSERFRDGLRSWRQRNTHRHDALVARRRARLLDAFVADVDRRAIYERDQGRCGICGGSVLFEEMDLDHVVALARGGTHEPANVQAAHARCNRRKGAR